MDAAGAALAGAAFGLAAVAIGAPFRLVTAATGVAFGLAAAVTVAVCAGAYVPFLEKKHGRKARRLLRGRRKAAVCGFCAAVSAICGAAACVNTVPAPGIARLGLCSSVFLCALVTDAELSVITNACPLALTAGRLLIFPAEVFCSPSGAVRLLLANFAAGAACFFLLVILMKITGGIGAGDAKLVSSFCFLCGARAACRMFFFSLLLCASVSVVLLFLRRIGRRDSLPMGPFMWAGFVVSFLLSFS